MSLATTMTQRMAQVSPEPGGARSGSREGDCGGTETVLHPAPHHLLLCRRPGLHPCRGSGQGPHRGLEEAEGAVWLPGRKRREGGEGDGGLDQWGPEG